MAEIRIMPNDRNGSCPPLIRTLSDALSKLTDLRELPPDSKLELLVCSAPGRLPFSAALLFRSLKGDNALFSLPFSKGFWATSTLGSRSYMTLDRLHGAEADCDGNVRLQDGTYVHAISLDVMSLHFELPELEEIIVYLTIRYLKAEAQCFRNDYGFMGIDYAALPHLRVPNVKALTRYVNATIGAIPRRNGAPQFKNIRMATVHRTLDLVHIQKVQGRPMQTMERRAS